MFDEFGMLLVEVDFVVVDFEIIGGFVIVVVIIEIGVVCVCAMVVVVFLFVV